MHHTNPSGKSFKYLVLGVLLSFSFSRQSEQAFVLILLPDTQTYTSAYPEILQSQADWIAKNSENIAFVLQQGDITDNNNDKEWQVAAEAFRKLDGRVPYTVAPGNHDTGENGKAMTRTTGLFNKYFPYEKYSANPTFGGTFIPGTMDNTWHTFKAGGIDWLIFSLEFGPRTSVLSWASEVIESHPDHKVIINTHAYLYSDDTRMDSTRGHMWLPQEYGLGKNADPGAVNSGEQMWDKLVKNHPNIMFVFSGHVLNDGTGLLVSEGTHGNKVYQMMANYQGGVEGSVKGGNGFLRIITIDPGNASINVKTYSPYTDQFNEDPDQQFVIENVAF